MIRRTLIAVLPAALLLSACTRSTNRNSSSTSSANDRGPAVANDEGADASKYAASAAQVTDACTLLPPPELLKKIVPGANAPQGEQYPRRCSVSNGTLVLEITIETGMIVSVDPVNGAEFVPGLAAGGYLERLDPYDKGDTYLTVILGKNPRGLLHVEVAGHDGKDHKDEAISVARDILTALAMSGAAK